MQKGMISVNEISSIFDANGIRAAEFKVEPYATGEHHYHSEVTEHCYCLKGKLLVEIETTKKSIVLLPGEKVEVSAGVTHSVTNLIGGISRYLVVQGVGKYNFIKA
jgi:quercetin dioxygenase-like cupin family protein